MELDDKKTSKKFATSIRLNPELRKRVDQRLFERKYGDSKLTFEEAFHEALELWLEKEYRLPAPTEDPAAKAVKELTKPKRARDSHKEPRTEEHNGRR